MTVMNPEELIGEGAVRDPDLVAKLKEAQGRGGYDFMVKHCVLEQETRDRQTLLPRDKRRRAQTRTKLDLEGNKRDDLRHIHSVLAICGLPYTRQPIEVREYQRSQGRMNLIVEAGKLQSPDGDWITQPLPFGSRARLLLLHLCSEAIRQKSSTIEIADSLTGLIRSMGYPVTGGKNGTLHSFKAQVNALAACHMRIGVWDGHRARTVNTQPFSALDVWFPQSPDQKMLWPSTITFSHEFFTTLTEHALPINMHAVKAFANSPRKLDILFWLGYRLNTLTRQQKISWDALKDQWGQGYSRANNFRRDFVEEIGDIKELFPKLPVTFQDTGITILPADPDVLALPKKRS